MAQYEEVKLKLQKGDRIKSKKGILLISAMSEIPYNEYELEYMGDGHWRSIGKRDKLENVKTLKEEGLQ